MRKPKKYHFVYKTTNTKTGKYYYGMHSTNDINDGYLGSGKRLRYSIKKYGEDCHVREIIQYLPDRKSLKSKEKEIITLDEIANEHCMNLQPGGGGGFISEEHRMKFLRAGGRAQFQNLAKQHIHKLKTDPEYKEYWIDSLKGRKATFAGRTHTEETKRKMSASKKGKYNGVLNPQYGKKWITDGLTNRMIKKTDTLPEGWKFGRVM